MEFDSSLNSKKESCLGFHKIILDPKRDIFSGKPAPSGSSNGFNL